MAFSRTILVAGSLMMSASLAEAQGQRSEALPVDPPIPVERPLLMDVGPATAQAGAEVSANGTKRSRHGRGSRLARTDPLRGSLPAGTEAPAPTPADTTVAVAGPHESAAPTLGDLVARHALENGVPVGLAKAVVTIESRGNPRASNGGALGLMQIKPGTARAAGFSGGAAGLFVAETNLHFGMKILGEAFRSSGGDMCRTLMRYQSGHLATHMTRSNRIYCNKARSIMAGA